MSNGAEDLTLADRVEFPTIPKSARNKIANLQEQFIRAEVEQCKFQLFSFGLQVVVLSRGAHENSTRGLTPYHSRRWR